MRLIFIRHGEPDYVNDSLTEKGIREAKLLGKRISAWNVTDYYTSPLGRAKKTAEFALEHTSRIPTVLEWTREFSYFIHDPVTGKHGVPWDFVPSFWTSDSHMFSKDNWTDADVFLQNPDIAFAYKNVCEKLDDFLAGYGYIRDNKFYRKTEKEKVYIKETIAPGSHLTKTDFNTENEDVVVVFCHLGIICVLLSHLLNIPFPLLVHGFFLTTTSVTILSTEERWDNEAYFRVQAMGDVNHLLSAGEPVSSAGYFTESFQN